MSYPTIPSDDLSKLFCRIAVARIVAFNVLVKKHLVFCQRSTSSCALNPEQHPIRLIGVRLAARSQSELMTIRLIEENGEYMEGVINSQKLCDLTYGQTLSHSFN